MGNSPSTIGIRTDQTTYIAGSTITGRVYLAVNNRGGVNANSINLRLTGVERTVVVQNSSAKEKHCNGRQSYIQSIIAAAEGPKVHNDCCTEQLIRVDVPVKRFDSGRISKGQYEFPFELTLPSGLPGTMQVQNGDNRCEVRYEIGAHLVAKPEVGGVISGLWGSPPETTLDTRELRVLGSPRHGTNNTPRPIVMPVETERIYGWFCFDKGSMTLSSEINKDALYPGETARVTFRCKNNSTESASGVRVAILERIAWTNRLQSETKERVLCEQFVHGDSIPDIRPSNYRAPKPYRHYTRHALDEYDSLDNALAENSRSSALLLPMDAQESYDGSLIRVTHTLVVQLKTTSGAPGPESSIRIRILSKALDESSLSTSQDQQQQETLEPSAPPMQSSLFALEAESILPFDWNAETAELVSIPVAQAVFDDSDSTAPVAAVASAYNSVSPPMSSFSESLPPDARICSVQDIESELAKSSAPYELIDRLASNASVLAVFQNLTPDEYASLILQVNRSTDQIRIAKTIAIVMGDHFFCSHVLACAILLPSVCKVDVLIEVAPLARDLYMNSNMEMIESELNDSEKIRFRSRF